jgi:hypothetical protein
MNFFSCRTAPCLPALLSYVQEFMLQYSQHSKEIVLHQNQKGSPLSTISISLSSKQIVFFVATAMCLQLHFTTTNFMNPNTTGDESRNHTASEP